MSDTYDIVEELRRDESKGELERNIPRDRREYIIERRPKKEDLFESDEFMDDLWFSLYRFL